MGINYTVILVFIVFFDTTSKLMTNDVPIFLCLCISITHYTHTKVKTYWILRFMKEVLRGIVFLKNVVKKYHDNYCIDRVCIEKKHTYNIFFSLIYYFQSFNQKKIAWKEKWEQNQQYEIFNYRIFLHKKIFGKYCHLHNQQKNSKKYLLSIPTYKKWQTSGGSLYVHIA